MNDSSRAAAHPVIHRMLSQKGGRAKVRKGFAMMDPERRKEVTRRGGINSGYSRRLKAQQKKEGYREPVHNLEELLELLDEIQE